MPAGQVLLAAALSTLLACFSFLPAPSRAVSTRYYQSRESCDKYCHVAAINQQIIGNSSIQNAWLFLTNRVILGSVPGLYYNYVMLSV